MDFPYVDTPADFASTYGIYRKARFSVPVAFVKAATFFVVLALLKHSDLCIAVSNYTAKFLLKNGVSQNRIRISGNGVDTDMIERFRASRKLYEGVFVGRIARDKGVFDLVEVWKRIATDRPEAKLLIIGTGPDSSKLKECAETANMTSNIILKGWCKDAELYSLMKTSELFLFPSRFEGWGLAVGEALACGLPVVCYDIPALREIFGKCGSVFFVPTGDTDRFTETSERILHNGDFSRLGAISKEYAKYFSWRKVALNDLAMIRTHVQSEFAEDQFKKVDQQ
jgi:glycosyltransferase involved in cell wall biosynthesis